MQLRCFFAVAMFALCTAAAQADTFQVFDLTATFKLFPSISTDYQTVTGPITIDTTIGTVTATDLTLTVYDTQGHLGGQRNWEAIGHIRFGVRE